MRTKISRQDTFFKAGFPGFIQGIPALPVQGANQRSILVHKMDEIASFEEKLGHKTAADAARAPNDSLFHQGCIC